VKLQVEFNPARVKAYRLIGYENRILRPEEFNDDKKDAGDLGAGMAVTALYEIVPAAFPTQRQASMTCGIRSSELAMLKFRYKRPTEKSSQVFPLRCALPPQLPSTGSCCGNRDLRARQASIT
jgi:Ca-activated chloride channel family protein